MDINKKSVTKPKWEILEFDDKISEIPCRSKTYGNPLDKNTAYRFMPDIGTKTYVYYYPKTNSVHYSQQGLYYEEEVAKLFNAEISDYYLIPNAQRTFLRTFAHGRVIGNCYVFRRFEFNVSCEKISNHHYKCSCSPVKEVCRYVFYKGAIWLETRDKTRNIASVEKMSADMMNNNVYDTLDDAEADYEDFLYQAFLQNVDIIHKEAIIRALSFVKNNYPKLGLKAFLEIYEKAMEDMPIE